MPNSASTFVPALLWRFSRYSALYPRRCGCRWGNKQMPCLRIVLVGGDFVRSCLLLSSVFKTQVEDQRIAKSRKRFAGGSGVTVLAAREDDTLNCLPAYETRVHLSRSRLAVCRDGENFGVAVRHSTPDFSHCRSGIGHSTYPALLRRTRGGVATYREHPTGFAHPFRCGMPSARRTRFASRLGRGTQFGRILGPRGGRLARFRRCGSPGS